MKSLSLSFSLCMDVEFVAPIGSWGENQLYAHHLFDMHSFNIYKCICADSIISQPTMLIYHCKQLSSIQRCVCVCVYFGQAPPLLLLPSSLLLQLGRNDKVQCEYAHFTHRLLVSFKYKHIMHTNFQNVCVFHLLKWKCVYAIPLSPLLLECVLRM